MKTVYLDEKNIVLNGKSVERKPCINRGSKRNELTIKLYSCHNINMKFLVVLTPPSIYHILFIEHKSPKISSLESLVWDSNERI